MTFDSGNLHSLPWEVVAKAYRNHLDKTHHDHLGQYAASFFSYIEKDADFFSAETKKKQMLAYIQSQTSFLTFCMDQKQEIRNEADPAKKLAGAETALKQYEKIIAEADFIGNMTQANPDKLLADHEADIENVISNYAYAKWIVDLVDIKRLTTIVATALFKKPWSTLETTGLVIAGFGERDYFPRLEMYNCYSTVMDTLVVEKLEEHNISEDNVSEIVPIAQSEMAKGFMYGLPPRVMGEIESGLVKAIDEIEDELRKINKLQSNDNIDKLKEIVKDKFKSELIGGLVRSHTTPMKRVVGLLPADELAELAEILVRMELIKERFTRDTEEVGGPIDVAVITKGDGFIWIKRKHYFDPKLNPRFFSRRGMTHHE